MILSGRSKKSLFAFTALVFVLVVSVYTRFSSHNFIYGDQVHYLVMSHSLLDDGDLNLKDDYRNKDYLGYFNNELDPHVLAETMDSDSVKWYSLHNPGLPILISPILYFLDYRFVFCFLIVIACFALILSYYWVDRFLRNDLISFFSTLTLFFSVFYLGNIGYIFPDLLSASLLLAALILLFKEKNRRYADLFLFGLILGAVPWVHVKMTLMAFTIGMICLYQIFASKSPLKGKVWEIMAVGLPALALILLFELKLYEWYGVILPSDTFASGQMFQVSPLKSLLAIFFDSTKGVFVNNPLFFLLLAGVPLWFRFFAKEFAYLLLIILPSFFLFLTFGDWWGGYSPSGRYFLYLMMMLLPAIGFFIRYLFRGIGKIIFSILAFLQFMFALVFIFGKFKWYFPGDENPIFALIKNVTKLDLALIFPKFSENLSAANFEIIYPWIVASVVLFIWGLIFCGSAKGNHPAGINFDSPAQSMKNR